MRKNHMQGIVASVASATATDVFSGSTGPYPFPAAAAATTIVSTSANDTAAGTGAQTVKVTGIGTAANNYPEIFETVALNGVTGVNLVNQYLRINRVEVLTAGTDATNDGIVSVKQGATVIAAIAVGAGRSQMAIFTASGTLAATAIKKMFMAATNAVVGNATFTLFTRKVGGIFEIRHVQTVYGTNCPSDFMDFASPIPLAPGEDVRISVTTNAAATAVAAGFDIWEGSSTEFNAAGVM